MQKKIKVLVLVIAILFVISLTRDLFIKSFIGTVAAGVTGAPVHIGGFSLSVIRQTVRITDFRMYNPEGFPRAILVDIPKIGVSCNLAELLKGKLHFKQIDFELKEVNMVKNKEGKLNVDALKITESKKAAPGEKEAKKAAPEMALQIDLANFAIGKIVSKDYSVSGPPVINVYEVNLKKSYKNITSARQLAALIISEPLKAAGIKGLKVYAATVLTSAAILPVAAVLTFTGKDFARASLAATMNKAYAASLLALKEAGAVKKEDMAGGIITAEVNGAVVTLKLKKLDDKTTEIIVSARKFGLPKPEIASGVVYRITEKLK